MRGFIALMMALALSGCVVIDMDCPPTGGETIAVGGSTVGNQIVTMGLAAGQGAMKSGGLMAREGAAAPGGPVMHVHYSYLAWFGSDYVACQATGSSGGAVPVTVVNMPTSMPVTPAH